MEPFYLWLVVLLAAIGLATLALSKMSSSRATTSTTGVVRASIPINTHSIFKFLNGHAILRETDRRIADDLGLVVDGDERYSPELLAAGALHFGIGTLEALEKSLRDNQDMVVQFSHFLKPAGSAGNPAKITRGHSLYILFDMLAARTGSIQAFEAYENAMRPHGLASGGLGPDMIEAYRQIDSNCAPVEVHNWKSCTDALVAFGSGSLLAAKAAATEELRDAKERATEAEAECRQTRPRGRILEGITAGADVYDAARKRLSEIAHECDALREQLQDTEGNLRNEIRSKLQAGTLVAKGFRFPHVSGNVEIEVPSQEWRILNLDHENSMAITTFSPTERKYIGVMIRKA